MIPDSMPKSTGRFPVLKVAPDQFTSIEDTLAVEEPLEIKIGFGPSAHRQYRSLAVTMRTPGHDKDLATGFLFTEGIIGAVDQIREVRHVGHDLHPDARDNVILVELHPEVPVRFEQLSRHFYTSSSCGVCGKASIEMVRTTTCYYPRYASPQVNPAVIGQLPKLLRQAQEIFDCTGGIHAAGLFDAAGNLLISSEDVGRHNALDKLIGSALHRRWIPLRDHLVLVSGRLSFELVQKSLMAGIPVLTAVGAPSSLAIELADEYGMTIIGFLRDGRFNVYCGTERLAAQKSPRL